MTDDPNFFEIVGTEAFSSGESDAPQVTGIKHHEKPMAPPTGGAISTRRWARSDDVFWPASDTCDKLPAAFYQFSDRPNIGPCLVQSNIQVDDLLRLPDTAGAQIFDEFAEFWTLKDRFTQRGFLFKRGILLWGPAGSGKTASLMLMATDIIARYKGIVCQIENPGLAAYCLEFIRKIEPERPIVALIEDLDTLVQRYGENQYLSLLDGETQINGIAYIATTNYPERLDRRFVDRPSRFDTVRWIGMPSADARRVYLHAKEPSLDEAALDEWVARTKGFSVAHLRELVILVMGYGKSLNEAIGRLDEMRLRHPDSEKTPDRPVFGIVGGRGKP